MDSPVDRPTMPPNYEYLALHFDDEEFFNPLHCSPFSSPADLVSHLPPLQTFHAAYIHLHMCAPLRPTPTPGSSPSSDGSSPSPCGVAELLAKHKLPPPPSDCSAYVYRPDDREPKSYVLISVPSCAALPLVDVASVSDAMRTWYVALDAPQRRYKIKVMFCAEWKGLFEDAAMIKFWTVDGRGGATAGEVWSGGCGSFCFDCEWCEMHVVSVVREMLDWVGREAESD